MPLAYGWMLGYSDLRATAQTISPSHFSVQSNRVAIDANTTGGLA